MDASSSNPWREPPPDSSSSDDTSPALFEKLWLQNRSPPPPPPPPDTAEHRPRAADDVDEILFLSAKYRNLSSMTEDEEDNDRWTALMKRFGLCSRSASAGMTAEYRNRSADRGKGVSISSTELAHVGGSHSLRYPCIASTSSAEHWPISESSAHGGGVPLPARVATAESLSLPPAEDEDDDDPWPSRFDRSASPAMTARYLHRATDDCSASADGRFMSGHDGGSDPWPESPSLPPAPAPAPAPADPVQLFRTKLVTFNGRTTPIVLQDVNGACPLIAICNVLLLRGAISLGEVAPFYVTSTDLVQLLAERVVDANIAEGKDECDLCNRQQNIDDAFEILPKLVKGLDVNPKFRKFDDVEFTKECAIFDVFNIGLYHGWIVDPQDIDTATAIGSKSYNTLASEVLASEVGRTNTAVIDKLGKHAGDREEYPQVLSSEYHDTIKDLPCAGSVLSSESSDNCKDSCLFSKALLTDEITHAKTPTKTLAVGTSCAEGSEHIYQGEKTVCGGKLIRDFLDSSASQLTIHGLLCLHEGVEENELCVLFRNNHFNTMYKLNGQLFLLVTDEGYADQTDLVWEHLKEIGGDSVFMDGDMNKFKAENQINDALNEQRSSTSAIDYLAPLEDSAPTMNAELPLAIESEKHDHLQQNELEVIIYLNPDVYHQVICSYTTIAVLRCLRKWYAGSEMLRGSRTVPGLPEHSDSEGVRDLGSKYVFLGGWRFLALISGDIDDALKICLLLERFLPFRLGLEPFDLNLLHPMVTNYLVEKEKYRWEAEVIMLDCLNTENNGMLHLMINRKKYGNWNYGDKPFARGSGGRAAMEYMNSKVPPQTEEQAVETIQGAMYTAFLKDDDSGGECKIMCSEGENGWRYVSSSYMGDPERLGDIRTVHRGLRRIHIEDI